ncbi:hypothetical protein [Siccibacter turicensis]|nr:hypothetical protein [Siccibacter turicensis]MDY0971377.1 hypothetical protein [Siccibacter turicensis]
MKDWFVYTFSNNPWRDTVYVYSAFGGRGGHVDQGLKEQVMLERVELIARLTSEGASQERDREIALNLIAELASGQMMTDGNYSVTFSVTPTTKK